MPNSPSGGRVLIPWPRMNLWDLMIVVLAAGLSLGMARGARGVNQSALLNDRTVGVAAMVLAVWLCVPLFRQAIASGRADGGLATKVWPIAWRLAIVIALAWLAIEEGTILRLGTDEQTWFSPMELPPRNRAPIVIRLGVLPILLGFALVGVVCCLVPGRGGPRPRRRGVPLRWLMIPLAAVAGLLLAASQTGYITYLVLIAIDGVMIAMRSHSGQGLPDVFMRGAPPLDVRLARTGGDVLAAFAVCVITGMIVSRDLRRDLSAEPLSWRGFGPRMVAVAATFALGMRLVFVTTRMLHPSFYDALWFIFEGRDVAAIVGTLGLFGIGLAARAVAPRLPSRPPSGLRWTARTVGVISLPVLTFLGLLLYSSLLKPSELQSFPRLAACVQWAQNLGASLQDQFPLLGVLIGLLWLHSVAWVLVLIWLVGMVVLINAQKPGSVITPLDDIVATRARLGWFVWCSSAVTAVCLSALPAFALGGLLVFHLRVFAGEYFGWKLP